MRPDREIAAGWRYVPVRDEIARHVNSSQVTAAARRVVFFIERQVRELTRTHRTAEQFRLLFAGEESVLDKRLMHTSH